MGLCVRQYEMTPGLDSGAKLYSVQTSFFTAVEAYRNLLQSIAFRNTSLNKTLRFLFIIL